jgi:hypothetical protein
MKKEEEKMKIGITERGDAGLDQSWKEFIGAKILITKAPQLLNEDDLGTAIIHCTITGFGGTKLEPGVNTPTVTLDAYRRLVNNFGGERVVLRIDPIIPTEKGIRTALGIFKQAKGRVRISFLDLYPHVKERFQNAGFPIPWEGMHAPLDTRKSVAALFPDAEICGEPGLECTGCVSQRDLAALGITCKLSGFCGQRKDCKCSAEKHELLDNKRPCQNGCRYCYWK